MNAGYFAVVGGRDRFRPLHDGESWHARRDCVNLWKSLIAANGEIDPDEITPPLPYWNVWQKRDMTLTRSYDIERWQEAARVYFALDGVSGERIRPETEASVRHLNRILMPRVPEFGLPSVTFPYIQEIWIS